MEIFKLAQPQFPQHSTLVLRLYLNISLRHLSSWMILLTPQSLYNINLTLQISVWVGLLPNILNPKQDFWSSGGIIFSEFCEHTAPNSCIFAPLWSRCKHCQINSTYSFGSMTEIWPEHFLTRLQFEFIAVKLNLHSLHRVCYRLLSHMVVCIFGLVFLNFLLLISFVEWRSSIIISIKLASGCKHEVL